MLFAEWQNEQLLRRNTNLSGRQDVSQKRVTLSIAVLGRCIFGKCMTWLKYHLSWKGFFDVYISSRDCIGMIRIILIHEKKSNLYFFALQVLVIRYPNQSLYHSIFQSHPSSDQRLRRRTKHLKSSRSGPNAEQNFELKEAESGW